MSLDLPEQDWADALRREREGDASGYAAFLRAYAAVLRRIVRSRLPFDAGSDPHAAEDVVQEVLMAVHVRRDQWDVHRPLLPWLAAITRYKVIDALRRRQSERRVRIHLDDHEWLALIGNACTSEIDDGEHVERMVATLPPVEQAVVRRIGIDGLSPREAATATGMKEGTVRVAFHRALARLSKRARDEET